MKKLFIFLCIIITLSIPAFAQENLAEGKVEEEITWVIEADGTLRISGTGALPDYGRTSDQAPWYAYRTQVTAIIVEDGITSIGNRAFLELANATTIDIADSVTYLGQFFLRQSGITELTLTTDKKIAPFAFGRADVLEVINFTEDVKSFMGNAFTKETVTIKVPTGSFAHKYAEFYDEKYPTYADAVTLAFESSGEAAAPIVEFSAAGDNAFYVIFEKSASNWALEIIGTGLMKNYPYISQKSIDKGYKLTPMYYISERGVLDEQKIKSITVHDGITSVGNYAFYKCNKATSVSLPDGITSIGAGAFWACAKLTEINIPETVTKIDINAFNGCANLASVTIPDSVTEIGQNIFVKCNMDNLTVTTDNKLVIETLREQHSDVTINTSVVEEKPLSVSEVFEAEYDSVVQVEGYYVGVASEGTNDDKEMLIKDLDSDTLIAVRGVPYGTFPNYGYTKGDKVSFTATVMTDTTTNTSGKKYLEFSDSNGDIASSSNTITYKLDNVVTVSTWAEMKSLFKIGTIKEYTCVKFTGTFYLNYYSTTKIYRIHNNSSCNSLATMKPDGSRCAGFRNDIANVNIGTNWTSLLFSGSASGYPGLKVSNKSFVAVFTGADNYNYQLTILETDWITDN